MTGPDDPTLPPSASALRIDRSRPRRGGRGGGAWILGLLVLAAVAAVAGSFLSRAGGLLGGTEVAAGRALRVSANLASERTTASGYVVARTRAAVSPRQPGKLARLLVDVGDPVKEGQLLAELEHVEEDAAVARWEAEVARAAAEREAAARSAKERAAAAERARSEEESSRVAENEAAVRAADARREADRLKKLVVDRIVTESEWDRAEAQARILESQLLRARSAVATARAEAVRAGLDAETYGSRVASAEAAAAGAEASLRESRARRDIAFIRAPFGGRVLRKEAEVGEVIAPATTGGSTTRGALLTLADFQTLEMEVDVFERDVSLVEPGAPCRIVLDAYPREPFPGRVRQVVPTADRQKATVQVKVSFDAPDPRVLPEMGGKVVFLAAGALASSEADRVTVPDAALVERGGRRGVFLVVKESSDERVKFATVSAGESSGGRTTVKEGLAGGERVVLSPPPALEDGDLVTVKEGS